MSSNVSSGSERTVLPVDGDNKSIHSDSGGQKDRLDTSCKDSAITSQSGSRDTEALHAKHTTNSEYIHSQMAPNRSDVCSDELSDISSPDNRMHRTGSKHFKSLRFGFHYWCKAQGLPGSTSRKIDLPKPCITRQTPYSTRTSKQPIDLERCLTTRSSEDSHISAEKWRRREASEATATTTQSSGATSLRKKFNAFRYDPSQRRARAAAWTVLCLAALVLVVYSMWSTLASGTNLTTSVATNSTMNNTQPLVAYNGTMSNVTSAGTCGTQSAELTPSDTGNSTCSTDPNSCTLPAFLCSIINFFRNLA